jgi:hypothetical protein
MTQANFQSIEIHLKRLEVARNAWTGVVNKAAKDIDYHGNVISALHAIKRTEKEQQLYDSSWEEVARANKRLSQAEKRLKDIDEEESQLLELSKISKAKEFMREVNSGAVEWIEEGYHYIYCNRCGDSEQLLYKPQFLQEHSGCGSA